MADYYPLIARAIAGLDPSAPGEARRALYERARAALIAQLRGVQPPLSESEITRERLSLEEAVRKVESEAAQRARDATRSGDAPRSGDATRSGDASRAGGDRARAGDSLRANVRPNARPGEPSPPGLPPSASPPRPRPPQSQPHVPMQDPQLPPTRERSGAPRRGADNGAPQAPGMRGFRDIAADADDLGRAAAQANRSARKTYANVPSPSPEFDRLEPNMENRGADPDAPYPYDETAAEADRYGQPQPPSRSRLAQDRERGPKQPGRVGAAFPFKSAIAVGIVLILVGAAILWGKSVVTGVSGLFKPSTVAEAPKDAGTPLSKPKIPDRVGQPSSTDQVAPVAQRVVLYDEDPADPKGKQYVGSVIWRTEQIKAAGGQNADIAVRADIEIPDRKFKVTDGFFLVGLSNVDADRQRNLQLLKERSWFDVPLVYVNQRRAIIAIEKGAPGERAFNDAFATWGEYAAAPS